MVYYSQQRTEQATQQLRDFVEQVKGKKYLGDCTIVVYEKDRGFVNVCCPYGNATLYRPDTIEKIVAGGKDSLDGFIRRERADGIRDHAGWNGRWSAGDEETLQRDITNGKFD